MKIYTLKILDISEEILNKLFLYIDVDKRCEIKRKFYLKDKLRTLMGDILIRAIINKELKISNKDIIFKKNEYGKLSLKGYPKINFNISHSGNFVVCAIDNKPIGIDIEEKKYIDYKEIAENFFSESELQYIINKDSNLQLNRFYEIWTLKESFVKCCGQGLSMPLNSFSINIDKSENIKVKIKNLFMKYTFKNFHIEPNYKMAVCSLNKKIPNNIIIVDQNRLINFVFNISLIID